MRVAALRGNLDEGKSFPISCVARDGVGKIPSGKKQRGVTVLSYTEKYITFMKKSVTLLGCQP